MESSLRGSFRRVGALGLALFLVSTPAHAYRLDTCPSRVAAFQTRVAVVDAYSAGVALAPRFKAMGYEVVHVASTKKLAPSYVRSHRPGDFVRVLDFDGDVGAVAEQLRTLGVTVVVPGSEPGVELADALSEALGVRTNGTALSEARRNKFLMHERLKAMGVRSLRQKKATELSEIRKFVLEENEGHFPVVVKPLKGAGSQGVSICENLEQVEKAFGELMGAEISATGVTNEEVLVQEYLKGDEYVVDLMSLEGRTLVTDLWRYHKALTRRPDGGYSNLYDYDELLDFDDPAAKALVAYGLEVIGALGITNGPAHMEVILTERGPVLVEVGARLIGGGTHYAVGAATGTSPVELMAEVYGNTDAFRRRLDAGEKFSRRKTTWMVQLASPRAGVIEALPFLGEIQRLESYYPMDFALKPGDTVSQTIDLMTSPGQFVLMHEDPEVVRRDYERIRYLERNGFYVFRR